MSSREVLDALQASLEQWGFKSAVVSAERSLELRRTIEEGRASNLINSAVFRQYAAYFENMLSQDVPWARSIVVVAVPRPALEVTFDIDGKQRTLIIPPTYEHSIDETVTSAIESSLVPHGFQICRAMLPLKLLAVRSGIARYGKNNVAYVEGMGSFHRLLAFYSDMPVESDSWREPQVLDACDGCQACTKHCPTGAIDPDRFQLHTERCLTLHNESSEQFPQWIDKSWHHCLVGCMQCQHYCPENKDVRLWKEHLAEFTQEETALILAGVTSDQMPPSIIAKFRTTGLLEDPISLTRNLKSALGATG